MRILLVTDAWLPQANGVVRTWHTVAADLQARGHAVEIASPDRFPGMPCPTYPEIRLALPPLGRRLARMVDAFRPDAIHIATEGPLGWAARRACLTAGLPFTTSFHTRFPEYLHARLGLPTALGYAVLRRFHRPAARTLVAAPSVRRELEARGFEHVTAWTRGVDTDLFRPRPGEVPAAFRDAPRPFWLYVGRVAVEKNVEAFLRLPLDGTKLVVGDGPSRAALARQFPDARFTGALFGEELARCFAASDVFVFPSRTDTFGLVMLEALAAGLPVAAYPVPGPLDVIGGAPVGRLDTDLAAAARAALTIDRAACRAYAQRFSWRACADMFLASLAEIGGGHTGRAAKPATLVGAADA